MTILTVVLIVKIGVTLFAVVLPFLMFGKEKLDRILQMTTNSSSLYRLYGFAVLALLVGYAGGIVQIAHNLYPIGVIVMGITSNAGAVLVLILTGAARQNRFLTGFFALVTVCLVGAVLDPDAVMAPLAN